LSNRGYSADFKVAVSEGEYNNDFFTITMTGAIEDGDSEKLRVALRNVTSEQTGIFRSNIMHLNSPGGSLDASISLANTIRKLGIATYVDEGAICLSGCAIAFMAGTWLDGDDTKDTYRVLHPKGILGFHAPFALNNTDGIDPEVAKLLLQDAERGGTIAASKLVKLSVRNILPTSLVEELLQYEADNFLYIDTVDRAGRWSIPLKDEGRLKTISGVIQNSDRDRLSGHCNNLVHWGNDVPFKDRTGDYGLSPNELIFDGLDNRCEYTQSSDGFSYKVNGKFGPVLSWQTLDASIRLEQLSEAQITGRERKDDPFANPPIQQVNGNCKNGFQWVGGWSGATYSDSIAYANYRSCDGSNSPLRLECKHGSGKIDTRLALKSFGQNGKGNLFIRSKIDDGYELSNGGFVTEDRGIPEFVSTLGRDYFTFENMMAGQLMRITVNDVTKIIHLSGSRQAISAMMDSCI